MIFLYFLDISFCSNDYIVSAAIAKYSWSATVSSKYVKQGCILIVHPCWIISTGWLWALSPGWTPTPLMSFSRPQTMQNRPSGRWRPTSSTSNCAMSSWLQGITKYQLTGWCLCWSALSSCEFPSFSRWWTSSCDSLSLWPADLLCLFCSSCVCFFFYNVSCPVIIVNHFHHTLHLLVLPVTQVAAVICFARV